MPYQPTSRDARAVLIGVDDYDDPYYGGLPSARVNVEQLGAVLRNKRHGRLPSFAITSLLSPTRDALINEVEWAADEAKSLLLCYFAGHGYLHRDPGAPRPELYLLPRTATSTNPTLHGIRYAGLRDLLAASGAKRVVLILDCCYSGNATREGGLPHRRAFALITSSKPQSRHGSGDGTGPSPFTRALLTALREGVDDYDVVTVDGLARRLAELAGRDAYRAGKVPFSDPGDWSPSVVSSNGAGDTVLSLAVDKKRRRGIPRIPPLPPVPSVRAIVRAVRAWFSKPDQPWWRRVVGGLGCLVALATLAAGCGAAGYAARAAFSEPPDCETPLQLNVLTTPEYEQSLSRVIEQFERSEAAAEPIGDQPEGCRQISVFVYSAPGSSVVDAFSASASWAEPERACEDGGEETCIQPLSEVGPRPDVWIPASSMSVDRVETATQSPESDAYLGERTTLARSPAVVAVPGELDGVSRTGESLADLLAAAEDQGLSVLRAAPESSDASLAFGAADDSGHIAAADDGVLPQDDASLLCKLAAEGAQESALLVTERTVVSLIDQEQGPACLTGTDSAYAYQESAAEGRYTAYYPNDVAELDLSFVPVRWEQASGDEAQRTTATERLRDWLTSAEGRTALAEQGFRDRDAQQEQEQEQETGTATVADTPLNNEAFHYSGSVPVEARQPGAAEVAEYLEQRQQGRGTRRVVFVVDVSSGSLTGERRDTIAGLLRAGIGALSDGDAYGLLATPGGGGSGGSGDAHWELGLDTHRSGEADQAIDGLTAVDADARIADALTEGFAALAAGAADDDATLLVLITDDEDSVTQPDRTAATEDVPVAVVTLGTGCDLAFNAALTSGPGSTCIEGADARDPARRLAEVVNGL